MIEWVFLDVGSVLFNDAPQDYLAMRFLYSAIAEKNPEYSFEEMLAEREQLAREGAKLILGQIAARYLTPDEIRGVLKHARRELFSRYDENNLLVAEAGAVIDQLRQDFRVGIIANQPVECRPSLARRGILDLFDVVAISDELNLRKPDADIFRWALDQAGVAPERAVMVGDRRDNDVDPAARLGMKTVWLDWPDHRAKNWFPEEPAALAFLESTDRVPYYGSRDVGSVVPDRTVAHLREVPEAALSLGKS